MATCTYASGNRTFEITLSVSHDGTWWIVERVYDKRRNEEIHVPGMVSIVASTVDAAFARTRDCIDKSLQSTPTAPLLPFSSTASSGRLGRT
jgi:hypothetical protein